MPVRLKLFLLLASLAGILLSSNAADPAFLPKTGSVTLPPSRMAGEDATIQDVVIPGPVRALPGRLDQVPLVSSNSPEWIKTGGILLSSFPPQGKTVAAAHLNLPLQGKFNLFTHHFTHTPKDLQTLYLGVIVQNPGKQAVTIDILQAASYLMEPDAPFKNKPPILENPNGEVFSGPGIRAVDTVLRGQRQKDFPAKVVIPPGEYRLLMNQPIPVKGLERPINGRSTFMRLQSSGTVYVADLAMFAPKMVDGSDRPPTLQEWQQLLLTGNLAGPRDKTPTPPNQVGGALIYSRVAGVQQGSTWQAQLVDPGKSHLALPAPGQPVSYAISTLRGGRLGTEQTQAAKLLVRYPDTAYESHANYATLYDLRLPLLNPTNQSQTFTLTLATPIKEDKLAKSGVLFRRPPPSFPYFRGTVRLRYADDLGHPVTRYLHLWQRTGQLTDPLVTLQMKPGEKRFVRLDFFYPPDSTPPQILTIATQAKD